VSTIKRVLTSYYTSLSSLKNIDKLLPVAFYVVDLGRKEEIGAYLLK